LKQKPGILALLHYFNSWDLSFEDVDAYFITANGSFIFYVSPIFLKCIMACPTGHQGS